MARELTREEVQFEFLYHVWDIVDFWERQVDEDRPIGDRLAGAVFSLLAMLDGEGGETPGFVVQPNPHPDAKQYRSDRGENYYPAAPDEVTCDIAGDLHNLFYQQRPKRTEA